MGGKKVLPDYQSHGLVGVKGNVLPPQKNKIEIPTSLGLRKHPTVVEKNVSAQKKWYHIIPFFYICGISCNALLYLL